MKHPALSLLAALLAFCPPARAADNPVTAVPLATALGDARRLADAKPGLSVVRVAGDSMLPYFGDGAVLVLRPARAAALQLGMLVVYTNSFGETVAHRIVAADGEGWVVQGFNNSRVDSTRVTDANLLGAVYATFHTAASAVASEVAAVQGVPLALAAPAR